ncbi:hypothetical protein ERICI_02234 [Paenibacillus larvae subsp. larvae]|uniref:Uncharacterized protein n=1 Tax=Paenibacillus larvae subsp. larvae TaxID=147375 RepID=A0A6C0QTR7_9BACL|nr:hypothetical protein ERICI_02234 [Paenibacillus larvae subsp. larvae]ETK27082.1 hypothetical protein ERIC1_1c05220 [Paenibacillus larvae subsp. larvae DSM 25719]QHZ52010.1 hypothetical protein ERICV_02891 [Paenibacillus larvae subsp. larvae]
MNVPKKLFYILQYLVLFIKKHYRLHFSKKMRFFSDEFTYYLLTFAEC